MRKGVSPIIATVLLIAITVTIAFIIFSSGKEFLTQLSPAPNCEGVVIEAGIYETADGYILEIDNSGDENIEGFSLIITNPSLGETDLESINVAVKAGESIKEEINFENNLQGKKLSIVSLIKNAEGKVMACDFRDAQDIKLNPLNSIPSTD
ncbi:MAG: archaellin/type IV pilin N-terminal domain-containing protein [Nanoarchaeota archaeon]